MATLKQKRVAKILQENIRTPVSRAMIQAGYAPSTARQANHALGKGFDEIMAKALPDSYLAKKTREFIDSKRQVRVFKKGDLQIETEETDPSAVKALDIGFKVRKKYSDTGITNNTINLVILPEFAKKYGEPTESEPK